MFKPESTDPSQDYVDDSEPERRLRWAEAKKRRTSQNQSTTRPPASDTSVEICVIDALYCPEGLGGVLSEATPAFVEKFVKETIGEESQSNTKPPPTSGSSLQTLATGRHATPASTQQLASHASATGAQEESSEPSLLACVGRLAYRQVRAKTEPSTAHLEHCQSASGPQVPNVKAERLCQRAKSLPEHDITKPDVSRLLKCVSCETRWTIQKGASNKLSHLVACARKKGISPSTLKILIVKENLKIQNAKTKDETTTPSNPVPAAPQTYMEAVVESAQPRKRQRRPDANATGTLQPISQTKAAILDRAKALLGTREIAPLDAPEPEPESTQAFGRSRLASEHIDPIVTHFSGESDFSSRLDLLRSMAESCS
ncbi:hypothetical protein H4582DRAFT_2051686 [Lactarius indigo]|nr:hypothetical protein H4582DRAFT_2051686 [Lactarius indigo]